jgi:CspA family cold shock protein
MPDSPTASVLLQVDPQHDQCRWTIGDRTGSPSGSRGDTGAVARGVVKFFKSGEGWGAISCDDLPDGQDVWIHFSDIEAEGYRAFEGGDVVDFDFEPAHQDSFNFRATRARRVQSGPAPVLRRRDNRVVIAPAGTPDTPLTPRRHRPTGLSDFR